MKEIVTQGITSLEKVSGSTDWYWGTDHTYGDLYEAEELFTMGHRIDRSRLILVSYPEGRVYEPCKAEKGQYFGTPVFYEEKIFLLLADFVKKEIRILGWDGKETETVVTIPRSEMKDCYNLRLCTQPLALIRQGHENDFDILWPEKASFRIDAHESFCCRRGNRLYFSQWFEDPDYREETLIRHCPDGEVLERTADTLQEMPDGQLWILR